MNTVPSTVVVEVLPLLVDEVPPDEVLDVTSVEPVLVLMPVDVASVDVILVAVVEPWVVLEVNVTGLE